MPLHSKQKQEKTFNGEIVAGSLLVAETREVARLLLQGGGPDVWKKAIIYVRKDPYGPISGDPEEIRYWANFCKTAKNKQRFTFFLTHEKEDSHDYSQPKNFLFHLAYNFMGHLVDILPQSTKIYRARRRKENQKFNHEDLTSPPPSLSQNSRMSPAGISFFYGGMDPEVCIHEVRPDVTETIEIAEFEVKKDLFVLELSHDFGEPRSIFDPYYDFSYEEFFKPFLQHFIHDISKPIRKTDNEIEYIPTQIFTEFIKSINFTNSFYSGEDEGNLQDVFINGIKFKSSIMNDGVNLVLFKGPEISNTYNSDLNDAWLYYKGSKTYQVNEIIVKSSATSIR